MNYYVVKYFSGFSNLRCLVVATSQEDAMKQFYLAHPKIRTYNVLSVKESNSTVYQLSER